uniref:Uncharacterized protein n=1 Tax=Anguilla anguilla TaxID=7936 RepID=A0A0E9VEI6_ANGAN
MSYLIVICSNTYTDGCTRNRLLFTQFVLQFSVD